MIGTVAPPRVRAGAEDGVSNFANCSHVTCVQTETSASCWKGNQILPHFRHLEKILITTCLLTPTPNLHLLPLGPSSGYFTLTSIWYFIHLLTLLCPSMCWRAVGKISCVVFWWLFVVNHTYGHCNSYRVYCVHFVVS